MSKLNSNEENRKRSMQWARLPALSATHLGTQALSSEARGINFGVIQLPVKHTNSRGTHSYTAAVATTTPVSHTRHLAQQIALKVPSDGKDVLMSTATGHALDFPFLCTGISRPHLWPFRRCRILFHYFTQLCFSISFHCNFLGCICALWVTSLFLFHLLCRLEGMFYLYAFYGNVFMSFFLWDVCVCVKATALLFCILSTYH